MQWCLLARLVPSSRAAQVPHCIQVHVLQSDPYACVAGPTAVHALAADQDNSSAAAMCDRSTGNWKLTRQVTAIRKLDTISD